MNAAVENQQATNIIAWIRRLMSFSGRAPRGAMIGIFCLLLFCISTAKASGTLWWAPSQAVVVASMILLLWIFIATSVRRLHDLGYGGHWFWVLLIPGVSQCVTLLLCCLPGKKGDESQDRASREHDERLPSRGRRVVSSLVFAWLFLAFVVAGSDSSSTGQDRCLQLLVGAVLPLYVLWIPWWTWITIRDRRRTEPERSWSRRLMIAVSVTWSLCVLCLVLVDPSESLSVGAILLLLFGILPLGVLWLAYVLWKKHQARRRPA